MGGHALNYKTKRLTKVDYETIKLEVVPKLLDLINVDKPKYEIYDEVNCVPFYIIPAYDTKESFGDMDIILNKAHYDLSNMTSFMSKLKELFNYTDTYINKPVISIDYKGFQLDLIFMKQKYMKSSLYYYSYNDLGNLTGRIAVKLGVRYGHFGLKKEIRTENNDRVLDEVILSSEPKVAFEFLGFDFERYMKGFETLEDVFEYVITSKYFNKEIFYYENLDHQNRTRNKKRDSYRKFLEYIEPKQFEVNTLPTKEENLNRIFTTFSTLNLEEHIAKLKEKEKYNNFIKSKFNGKIIMELIPELQGKELGLYISYFKNLFATEETFNLTIEENTQEEINYLINLHYKIYKESK